MKFGHYRVLVAMCESLYEQNDLQVEICFSNRNNRIPLHSDI